MNEKMNPSIGCDVTQCKYNCVQQQFCSLDKIYVSDCSKQVRQCKDTLCGSFESRE